MKKTFLIIISALTLMLSCSTEDNIPDETNEQYTQEQFDKDNPVVYEITQSRDLSVEEMADFIYGPDGANGDETMAMARRRFIENCSHFEDSLANATGQNAFTLIFETKKFNYETIDENGDPITLSAFMSYGAYWFFGKSPLDQNHIYFVCPYTHTREDECATASNGGWEYTLLQGDNLYVMPDGQGFGENKKHDQTYLNHNLHARQYYDALLVADRIYRDAGGKYEEDCDLRIIGTSQGAGDAIALHRYLDTTKYGPRGGVTLCYKWNFSYSYVCCGPYCPEVTLEKYLEWGKLSYPCVVPLVIKSMLASNPELAAKYKESDFYSDLWNKNKVAFDSLYLYKPLDSDDLNEFIRKKLAVDYEKIAPEEVPITRIFSAAALNKESQLSKDFMAALRKQDLTSGWTPKTKCYIYYSKKDDVVPYANTEKLIQLFGNKCSTEEAFWDSHVHCCEQFMLKSW